MNDRLLDLLQPITNRNQSLPSQLQVFIFLRFLGNGSFYNSIGDIHGVSKGTTCRIINKVSKAVATLHPIIIKFPDGINEIRQSKLDFFNIAGFPQILGAIDCTHIRLSYNVKKENAVRFVNRHNFYSINTQVPGVNKVVVSTSKRWQLWRYFNYRR